jgi:ribosomal protein S12 methylthiotransferase
MRETSVHIVSLGCPKNLIDSEVMAALLEQAGCRIVSGPEEADILLLNTCAFILPAREESIDEIFRLAEWKKAGKCRHLIVTGCLPQRYGAELAAELPEVDLFLGISEVPNIADHLRVLMEGKHSEKNRAIVTNPCFSWTPAIPVFFPRPRTAPTSRSPRGAPTAVPTASSRGSGKSAQPTNRGHPPGSGRPGGSGRPRTDPRRPGYHRLRPDLEGKPTLALLLRELAGLNALAWIRILYTYPTG